ncbi:MAG: putative penicillin-binding protein [Herminiimonas sp.]|nr:putative penicillin-binding protein [Herminiimonas sp.]
MRSAIRMVVPASIFCCLAVACGGIPPGSNQADGTVPSPFVPPNEVSAVPIPPGQIDEAVASLDRLASDIMAHTAIPGMAIAVVRGGKTVYAKGFGVRQAGLAAGVDADTVFPLASISKSIGATVVAQQVSKKMVQWNTPVRSRLPWFALADPFVTQNVTIGDLYSHRSGLPDHAGDKLEDLGYGRTEVLQRLQQVPLSPFRSSYDYTNFGITAAAEAVASAAGVNWETLSEQAIYRPLGMLSTSSRHADFMSRQNRVTSHLRLPDGTWVAGAERNPDAQSAAGGVSASVNDMARWLTLVLANGAYDGRQVVESDALLPVMSPQSISSPPSNSNARAGFYGYGFGVGTSAAGRVVLSHSGAFALGASTNFTAIPSADIAIVILTNAGPIGVPETVAAQFADLVQLGRVQQDWEVLYRKALAPLMAPVGSLVDAARPANPAPRKALSAYTGTYQSAYYGPLQVVDNSGSMELRLGPQPMRFPLSHWDGDVFSFMLNNENAPPGTISKASFSAGKVVLEFYDDGVLGTFTR